LGSLLKRHPLLGYGLIAYGVTFILLIGVFVADQFGILPSDSPIAEILGQIAASGPALAALVMVAVTQGRAGLKSFLKKIVLWRVGPAWYLFVLFGIPIIAILGAFAYGALSLQAVLEQWPILFTSFLPAVAIRTIVTGLAEEPGWRGFVLPRMQAKHGPLLGIFLHGLFWTFWHLPNLIFQAGGLPVFAWFIAATTVNGFVLAWVYNRTRGSILIAMILHAAQNSTVSLVGVLMGVTGEAFVQFYMTYMLISVVSFGLLMVIVAIFTRGRFGYQPTEGYMD